MVKAAPNVRFFLDDISDFECLSTTSTKLDKYCIRSPAVKKALIDGQLICTSGEATFRLKGKVYQVSEDGVKPVEESVVEKPSEERIVEEVTA